MSTYFTTQGLSRKDLSGCSIVPMLTPATAAHELDMEAVDRLVEHILAGGCKGIMVCGTTGEFASLTIAQRVALVRQVVCSVDGRGLVFSGIGATCMGDSKRLAEASFEAGADAVVANLPYYYPLSALMMETYFQCLADQINGPIYLYNIPQTTRHSVPLDVLERLSRHPRIMGLKDSEPDGERLQTVAKLFAEREDFAVFCGSMPFTNVVMRSGGDGFVPSAGNFLPTAATALMEAHLSGNEQDADAAQERIDTVNAAYQKGRSIAEMFAALKGILEIMGLGERHMFPPLISATDHEIEDLSQKLKELGITS